MMSFLGRVTDVLGRFEVLAHWLYSHCEQKFPNAGSWHVIERDDGVKSLILCGGLGQLPIAELVCEVDTVTIYYSSANLYRLSSGKDKP